MTRKFKGGKEMKDLQNINIPSIERMKQIFI